MKIMGDKSIIMSLSVKPDVQELLKTSAKKLGWSVSELVRILVQRHLSLVVNESTEIPVILRIPAALRGDPEQLRYWMSVRTDKIISVLSKPA
jgi:hypothetical protein